VIERLAPAGTDPAIAKKCPGIVSTTANDDHRGPSADRTSDRDTGQHYHTSAGEISRASAKTMS